MISPLTGQPEAARATKKLGAAGGIRSQLQAHNLVFMPCVVGQMYCCGFGRTFTFPAQHTTCIHILKG